MSNKRYYYACCVTEDGDTRPMPKKWQEKAVKLSCGQLVYSGATNTRDEIQARYDSFGTSGAKFWRHREPFYTDCVGWRFTYCLRADEFFLHLTAEELVKIAEQEYLCLDNSCLYSPAPNSGIDIAPVTIIFEYKEEC